MNIINNLIFFFTCNVVYLNSRFKIQAIIFSFFLFYVRVRVHIRNKNNKILLSLTILYFEITKNTVYCAKSTKLFIMPFHFYEQ